MIKRDNSHSSKPLVGSPYQIYSYCDECILGRYLNKGAQRVVYRGAH